MVVGNALVERQVQGCESCNIYFLLMCERKGAYWMIDNGDFHAAKMRMWRLQRLDVDVAESMRTARAAKRDADKDDMYEKGFLREVEADKEMRGSMNLYKSEVVMKSKGAEGSMNDEDTSTGSNPTVANDDGDDQQVKLDELFGWFGFGGRTRLLRARPRRRFLYRHCLWNWHRRKAAKDGSGFVGREHPGQI